MMRAVNRRPSSKLEGLQTLRAIAALMVLGHHGYYMLAQFPLTPPVFAAITACDWLRHGRAGVDIFFVISGFIIMYVTPEPLNSWKGIGRFLFRRFARIYPAYWTLSILPLAWRYWKADPALLPKSHAELLAWIFLLPFVTPSPLIVAWTLVYEVYFYVVSGFAFVLSSRSRALLAAAAFVFLLVFNLLPIPKENWPKFAVDYLSAYPLEFLAGLLIAYQVRVAPVNLDGRWAIALFGLAFAIILSLGQFQTHDSSAMLRVATYAPGSILLVWVVVQMDVQEKWAWFRGWAWLGDRSYSIYLLHYPIEVGVTMVMARYLAPAGIGGVLVLVLLFFAVIAVAVELSYRLVEKPCQEAAKKIAPHSRSPRQPALAAG